MKKTLCKSTLALAVAVASTGAYAGTLSLDDYTQVNLPILAEEIYGSGSEETLTTVPDFTFSIAGNNDVDDGDTFTVKLTLGGVAVFGEDLSDIDDWSDSDLTLVFNFDSGYMIDVGAASSPFSDVEFEVDVSSGGAIGDNTIVFEVTNISGGAQTNVELDTVNLGYFKIKNLTTLLEPQGAPGLANGKVNLVTEYQNTDEGTLDTAAPIFVLTSNTAWDVMWQGESGYGCGYDESNYDQRGMISSASGSTLFTGPTDGGGLLGTIDDGCQAAADFNPANDTDILTVGEFNVELNGLILKEDLSPFQLNGGDELEFSITSDRVFDSYDSIFIVPRNFSGCDAGGADASVSNPSTSTAMINLSGQSNSDMLTGWHLCFDADGVNVIPRANNFVVTLSNIDYFNVRYIDSMYDAAEFGELVGNGCTVTLFNVPNPNAGDTAFIRLTNITENIGGMVTADMWAEDGSPMLGVEATPLTAYLPAHATGIYTSDPSAPGSSVYLGDHVPDFDTSTGRSRIVLRGAFPTCEAMGLVRSPNGTLTNMTSTTYNGFDAWYGDDTNGTSNTGE